MKKKEFVWNCKKCGVVCQYKSTRQYCENCSPMSVCEHSKTRRYCRDCSPVSAFKRFLVKARSRKLSCSLSYEDWLTITKQPCAYCGSATEAGIDRVDSDQGYSSENSVSCCEICNYMKRAYSRDRFLSHVKKIFEFQVRL